MADPDSDMEHEIVVSPAKSELVKKPKSRKHSKKTEIKNLVLGEPEAVAKTPLEIMAEHTFSEPNDMTQEIITEICSAVAEPVVQLPSASPAKPKARSKKRKDTTKEVVSRKKPLETDRDQENLIEVAVERVTEEPVKKRKLAKERKAHIVGSVEQEPTVRF